jgi:hypothetical protein
VRDTPTVSPRTRVAQLSSAALATCAAALLAALAAGCAGLAPANDPRLVVRGPLPTRVILPQALVFPEPRPRRVRTQKLGTFGWGLVNSYASLDQTAQSGSEAVELDGDVLHTGLITRYGFSGNTELEVEFAASVAANGALRLGYDGATVWAREEDELALMDVPVHVTHIVRHPAGGLLGMALRAGVELPVGDEDQGTGSGGVDYDLGVLFERSRGRWTLTGGVDLVFIETPDGYSAAGVRPEDLCVGSFGAEYRWNDTTSLLGGLRYRTPFTDDFSLDEVDRPVLDVALGLARDAGAGRWFAALHEDVLEDSGPDFAVSFGYVLGF